MFSTSDNSEGFTTFQALFSILPIEHMAPVLIFSEFPSKNNF